MSAKELAAELLEHLDRSEPWDWLDVYTRAVNELSLTPSDSEREMLLFIYTAALNYGEAGKSENDLIGFRAARASDYFFIIMRECVDGQHLNMNRLCSVTAREVAAGRMSLGHQLCKLALAMKTLNEDPPRASATRASDSSELIYRASVLRASGVDGAVSASQLLAVTSIEVAAGRMSSDHELKKLADSVHAVVQSFAGEVRNRC